MITSDEFTQRRAARRAATAWRVAPVKALRREQMLLRAAEQGRGQGMLAAARVSIRASKRVSLHVFAARVA